MKKPCFNVIYEDDNITIPEIDNTELFRFALPFIFMWKRQEKENISSHDKTIKLKA